MTEQEAIEIAKSEAKLKGWEYNPDSIIAFKLKRKIFYWKNKWQVTAVIKNSNFHKDDIIGYTQVRISIDEISGTILKSGIRKERFTRNKKAIFPVYVAVLTPPEQILALVVSFLYLLFSPFYIVGWFLYLSAAFPISLVKEYLKPRAYCPVCKSELRTLTAKQCPHCFFAWHETL